MLIFFLADMLDYYSSTSLFFRLVCKRTFYHVIIFLIQLCARKQIRLFSKNYVFIPIASLFIFTMYQLYTPHHFPRPPILPPKPQRMQKSRPRAIFNSNLSNDNMEAFIQVFSSS